MWEFFKSVWCVFSHKKQRELRYLGNGDVVDVFCMIEEMGELCLIRGEVEVKYIFLLYNN